MRLRLSCGNSLQQQQQQQQVSRGTSVSSTCMGQGGRGRCLAQPRGTMLVGVVTDAPVDRSQESCDQARNAAQLPAAEASRRTAR